jgi:zinc transporter 1/2/3
MQLSAPAHEALNSPCLTGPITDYSWPEGIMLMTIFVMFFIELMVSRYDLFGHSHEEPDLETQPSTPDISSRSGQDDKSGSEVLADSKLSIFF